MIHRMTAANFVTGTTVVVCKELIITTQRQTFAPSNTGVTVTRYAQGNGPNLSMVGGCSENRANSCSVGPRIRVHSS